MSFAKAVTVVGGGFFGLIWIIAVISMRHGNPTAINAVIGIPIAMLLATPFVIITSRVDFGDGPRERSTSVKQP